MSNGVSRFKCDFDNFITRGPDRRGIELRIDLLERWLADIERFYPLPALSESVRQDIKRLLAAASSPVDPVDRRSLGRQRGVVQQDGHDAPTAGRGDAPLRANLRRSRRTGGPHQQNNPG